jgi:hypothetical protein
MQTLPGGTGRSAERRKRREARLLVPAREVLPLTAHLVAISLP